MISPRIEAPTEDSSLLDNQLNTIASPISTLTSKTLYGYSLGEITPQIFTNIRGYFLNTFLLEVTAIRPVIVGIILAISTCWDAITDPLIGRLSDKTITRWGRRRPWLVLGAPPLAFSWIILWTSIQFETEAFQIVYYGFCAMFAATCYTTIMIPYSALTPEIGHTYNDRTRLTSMRMIFGLVTATLAAYIHSILVEFWAPNYAKGYFLSALIFGILMIFPPWITAFMTKEETWLATMAHKMDHDEFNESSDFEDDGKLKIQKSFSSVPLPQETDNLIQQSPNSDIVADNSSFLSYPISQESSERVSSSPIPQTSKLFHLNLSSTKSSKNVRNYSIVFQFKRFHSFVKSLFSKPFFCVLYIFGIAELCAGFVQTNLFLFVKYVGHLEHHFPTILLLVQLGAAVFLPFWTWLSYKLGKTTVYAIGILFWSAVQFALFWAPPGDITWMLVLACSAGIGVSVGVYLIPWSLLPDVIDYDEYINQTRREGLYYAVFIFAKKLALSFALLLSNFLLDDAGYVAPTADSIDDQKQNDKVILLLRIMLGPIPGVLLLTTLVAAWFYPINEQLLTKIHAQLKISRIESSRNSQE